MEISMKQFFTEVDLFFHKIQIHILKWKENRAYSNLTSKPDVEVVGTEEVPDDMIREYDLIDVSLGHIPPNMFAEYNRFDYCHMTENTDRKR